MRGWVTCDGENLVMDSLVTEAMKESFKENLIDCGKLPASTSHIHQPCDVATTFLGVKKKLRGIIQRNDLIEKKHLEGRIKAVFDGLSVKYGFNFTNIKEKATKGILRVIAAMGKVVNQGSIQESFEECGQYPLDAERLFHQSNIPLTIAEVADYKDKASQQSDLFQRKGYLSETDMDEKEIPVFLYGRNNVARNESIRILDKIV
jgi:hypothetical protein